MGKATFVVSYCNLELEYLYDPQYIYYEEAIEMISCVCQNTMFPRSIKKMQSILNACARIRSNKKWRDDTLLPRLFDDNEKIDISQYLVKVGNPSANFDAKISVEDIWVRSDSGWVMAEKRFSQCSEKKPFRLFNEHNRSKDGRSSKCSRCSDKNTVEIYVI